MKEQFFGKMVKLTVVDNLIADKKGFIRFFAILKNVDFFVENGGRFEHKKSALQPRFDGDN